MARDKIGDVQFDLVTRPEHAGAMRAEVGVDQRDGIDGHDATGIGDRGLPFVWAGCHRWSSSAANAASFIAMVEALKGTIVTIYDTYEIQHDNILVVNVGQIGVQRPVIKDGDTKYLTVYRIEMQRLV